MARSFSTAKTVSALISNEISAIITRRGYAAAASSSSSQGKKVSSIPNMMLKKGSEETTKTTWAPDPVTGFYRPENLTKEIDAVELRAMLLKNKSGGQ